MKYKIKTIEKWFEIFKQYKPIIADTNFFLACFEKQLFLPDSIDVIVDQGYKLIVTNSVINEIENLAKKSRSAKTSLELIEKYALILDENLFGEDISGFVDDQIVELALKIEDYHPLIASGDKKVQKKALKKKIPVLTFKNKNLRIMRPEI